MDKIKSSQEWLNQAIFFGLVQAGNVIPFTTVPQNVPAIFAELAINRTNRKPPIRLAYADITPFSLFAGIGHFWAQIESIKQNCNAKPLRKGDISDCLDCQLSAVICKSQSLSITVRLGVTFGEVVHKRVHKSLIRAKKAKKKYKRYVTSHWK